MCQSLGSFFFDRGSWLCISRSEEDRTFLILQGGYKSEEAASKIWLAASSCCLISAERSLRFWTWAWWQRRSATSVFPLINGGNYEPTCLAWTWLTGLSLCSCGTINRWFTVMWDPRAERTISICTTVACVCKWSWGLAGVGDAEFCWSLGAQTVSCSTMTTWLYCANYLQKAAGSQGCVLYCTKTVCWSCSFCRGSYILRCRGTFTDVFMAVNVKVLKVAESLSLLIIILFSEKNSHIKAWRLGGEHEEKYNSCVTLDAKEGERIWQRALSFELRLNTRPGMLWVKLTLRACESFD